MPTPMYLSPLPVQQFTDNNGALLVGGQLFLYEAGTTTPQAAYTDSTGNTPLPNPIVLNSRGEVAPSATGTSCGLWLNPTLAYKIVLAPANDTNPPTNPYWTIDQVVSPQAAILAALAAYEASLAGVPIGGMMPYAGATAPSGWLLCYGQAVSRTTYAALFAVAGTAYGIGDGSTTFNLPDKRGRASIGADNMGGTPANRVTEAGSGVNATAVGNAGGSQLAQEDTITATSTALSVVSDPSHSHVINLNSNGGGPPSGEITSISGAGAPAGKTQPAATGITVLTSVTTTVSSSLTGASQNMPPVQVDNIIIYAGV
jgi:microcystin-dependent protein